ncbi:long-chain fatty acid--CoA ligase [Corynebacterium sp. HMSC29G08]|uniref:acyl-CoA synthetase n=1 Tax=Corynebacterium sp. HMSC29G08 TaxID=1581069 RepID=UPI0008A61D39|nr:long-chain fatty acid--CoA ligase [Corynebacterium sp. HMSC29G08]OFT81353.1 fatty-acid--CoA ligase [Corynebacterium sp. HMSC29G08]
MMILGVEHDPTSLDVNPCTQVQRTAQWQPEKLALVYEGEEQDYAHFRDTAVKWAAHLREAGVQQGDRVAYLGANSSSFIYGLMASWWIGAVFMPLNFRLSSGEISQLLAMGTPHSIIVEGTFLDEAKRVYGIERHHVLAVDTDPAAPPESDIPLYWSKTSHLEDIETAAVEKPMPRTMSELALLLFTSGTTGLPKGAQITFGNLWWNQINVDTVVDSRVGDTTLASAPLFHVGALNSFAVRALARGNTVVVHRAFDPKRIFDEVEKYKIGSAFLVPAQLEGMAQHPAFDGVDLTSLRAIICAGAPVPPRLIRTYWEAKSVVVQQAWGLTETSPFATYLPPARTLEKIGSCGIPMPHTEIKLVDTETGQGIKQVGVPGELWVKGPNVAVGYWNNPDATQKAYSAGWFHSGDIGYRDEDGYYYIVDRLKDLIISGGENVYPAEVERILAEHDDVISNAVVGVPDPKWGEAVVAVLQTKDGKEISLEEIREHCAKYLARYKLPGKVVCVDEIPRNPAGKINKIQLRQDVRVMLGEDADSVHSSLVESQNKEE